MAIVLRKAHVYGHRPIKYYGRRFKFVTGFEPASANFFILA
jgi:hypothetical protein